MDWFCGMFGVRTLGYASPKWRQGLAYTSRRRTLIWNTSLEVRGGCAVSRFCPVYQRQQHRNQSDDYRVLEGRKV